MKRMIVLAVVVLTAWGVPAAPSSAAGRIEVTLLGTQFAPQWAQVVDDGGGVVWTNKEPTNYPVVIGNHNIVPDSVTAAAVPGSKPFPASSPVLKPGDSWTCESGDGGLVCMDIDGKAVKIPPGRYTYMCGIHPNQMHGVLGVS